MKKLFLLLLIIMPMSLYAYDAEVDGIFYNLNKETLTATVTFEKETAVGYNSNYEGDVAVPSEITYEGQAYAVTAIGDNAFNGCYKMLTIKLPETIKSIGTGSFWYCKKIAKIDLYEGLEYIGDEAFKECESLVKVYLPSTLTYIGSAAFMDCHRLSKVRIPGSIKKINIQTFDMCGNLKEAVIEEGVEELGKRAFYDCVKLPQITLPQSVRIIGPSAFQCCWELGIINVGDNIETIGDYAFASCKPMVKMVLPNTVTHLGVSAFTGCCSLREIVLSNQLESIGSSAFNGCSNLKSIVIPNSVQSVGNFAFCGCGNLEEVTIGSGVKSINYNAFSTCKALKKLVFVDSDEKCVCNKNAQEGAFDNCPIRNLYLGRDVEGFDNWAKDLYFELTIGSGVTQWSDNYSGNKLKKITTLLENPSQIVPKFTDNAYRLAELIVPVGTLEAYKQAEGWKNFAKIKENADDTALENVSTENNIKYYYTIDGIKLESPVKGLNVAVCQDGTVRKIYVQK